MLAKLFRSSLRDFSDPTGLGANATTGLSIYDWSKMYTPGAQVAYGGNVYQAFKTGTGASGPGGQSFNTNSVVFALESIRTLLFSEMRFQFQQMRYGKPGDLFGTADLAALETPWPGHTTRDLLARAEMDVFSAGNSYWTKNANGLVRLDPMNVKLMIAKAHDTAMTGAEIGDQLIGYAYMENQKTLAIFEPEQIAHYKPYPDPNNVFLGMSWLSPCLADVALDDIIGTHKRTVLSNGARLSTVVSFDPTVSRESFDHFVDKFQRDHEGPDTGGKTLFLGAGADVKTVGQSFQDLTLQATQGSTEVRIASCAGIPPAIVGISEGLKGSSLNAGNYGEARRRLSDGTMRPLWGIFAGCMESVVPPPPRARLWYDDTGIAFLREDLKDQADILADNAKTVMSLVQGGWEPDAAIEAVVSGDLTRLEGHHTGLYSVQLQPPSAGEMGVDAGVDPGAPPPPPPAPAAPAAPGAFGKPAAPPAPAPNGKAKPKAPATPAGSNAAPAAPRNHLDGRLLVRLNEK